MTPSTPGHGEAFAHAAPHAPTQDPLVIDLDATQPIDISALLAE